MTPQAHPELLCPPWAALRDLVAHSLGDLICGGDVESVVDDDVVIALQSPFVHGTQRGQGMRGGSREGGGRGVQGREVWRQTEAVD